MSTPVSEQSTSGLMAPVGLAFNKSIHVGANFTRMTPTFAKTKPIAIPSLGAVLTPKPLPLFTGRVTPAFLTTAVPRGKNLLTRPLNIGLAPEPVREEEVVTEPAAQASIAEDATAVEEPVQLEEEPYVEQPLPEEVVPEAAEIVAEVVPEPQEAPAEPVPVAEVEPEAAEQ